MQKFLLIGVGGSGGKTLRYTYRELERRLRARGWTEGVPTAWQFLHVDVPERPDGFERDIPVVLTDESSYLGLAKHPFEYEDYDRELTETANLLPTLVGWRTDPTLEYNPVWLGAGQRRTVGRVVTIARLSEIASKVDGALSAMSSEEAGTTLDRLHAHLNAGPALMPDARVVVVTSLGGGAGSGAFLDIIQLLRARAVQDGEWLNDPIAVLFAADIFRHIEESQRKGVEPNTLAALSELLAAYEHQGPLAGPDALVLQAGGGALALNGRVAPRYNLIVGRRNSSIDFVDSIEVFRATGKALAAFLASPEVQRGFNTYLVGNWDGPELRLRIGAQNGQNPCSSFGYGNVTLGRALFARYAAERLARRALERLIEGHREGIDRRSLTRDETLIAARADEVEEAFFDQSGLWELGKVRNQVIDALRDAERKAKALDGVRQEVLAKLRAESNRLSPADWGARFNDAFKAAATKYRESEREERRTKAREWQRKIQAQVIWAVTDQISDHGLPVASELLDRLRNQVLESAKELERTDHDYREVEERKLLNAARQVFDTLRDRLIGSNHNSLSLAAQNRRDALSRGTEADLYKLSAELLRDIADRFLPQLAVALNSARKDLNASLKNQKTRQMVDQWSMGPVGRHLLPAPNEQLLQPTETFPSTLEELAMATFETEFPESALKEAVAEVLHGRWPAGDNQDPDEFAQTLVAQRSPWVPTVSDARPEGEAASVAAFQFPLTPERIYSRAERWVIERTGPVSRHVKETLAGWLDADHPDSTARAQEFVISFRQALRNAQPLVSINSQVLNQVHGEQELRSAPVMSPIPIRADHPARTEVENDLLAFGIDQAAVPEYFDPNYGGGEIEITTFLASSVHPIVFDSVVNPVVQDWSARRIDEDNRRDFWMFRRARSLRGFVPLSPASQLAMVRGWLTAGVLGYVDQLQGPWSAKPLNVWSPRGRLAFPPYLLGRDVTTHPEVLPSLMLSFPLALLSYASGHEDELRAYLRLIDLGTDQNGALDEYTLGHVDLERWIQAGGVATAEDGFDPAPIPPPEFAGGSTDGPDVRANAVVEALRGLIEAYAEIQGRPVTLEATLRMDPRWEIAATVMRSAEELISATKSIEHRSADSKRTLG